MSKISSASSTKADKWLGKKTLPTVDKASEKTTSFNSKRIAKAAKVPARCRKLEQLAGKKRARKQNQHHDDVVQK